MHEAVFRLIRAVWDNASHDNILAAGTIMIAIFTLTLWRSTHKLWKAGERQYSLTRSFGSRQLTALSESNSATRESAMAAQDAANIARVALITTERAFVYIDGFNVELTTAMDSDTAVDIERLPEYYRTDPGIYITRFAAQPRWKNGGNTPTNQMTVQVNWRGPPGPIPPDYIYRDAPQPFFLAPKATEPTGFIEMPSAQALVNWAMRPIGDSPLIFVWGRADYRDVFNQPHFIEWCYQLRLSRPVRNERIRANFIQWGEYNRSDTGGEQF